MMRFICINKADKHSESGAPPSPELVSKMGWLIGEMTAAGVFLGAEGLKASSQGVRLNFNGGKRTITDGPFTESKEFIAGYCIARMESIDQAVEGATRFAEIVGGDMEIDIRPLVEPWDLGMCQKPEGLTTTRFMMANKANEFTEAGEPPSREMIAKMGELIGDMQKSGVFIATAGLPPSSHGSRLRFSKGEHTITDGPFAESKELIGGFILLQVNSKQEAIEWALRIGEALGDSEIDVVPVCEAPASTAAA